MPLTLDDLFTLPEHYLHSFDGPDAIFVPMDAAAYRRSIFLDDRIQPVSEAALRVKRGMLDGAGRGPLPQVSWIFHIAHCGSTLLARALGELDDRLVLREPLALRQAAVARDPASLSLMLRMLGKRYADTAPPLVKANVPVNFAIPDIAAAMPAAPAIFLYYDLEDYLLAILRSENHRAWLHRVTGELASVLNMPSVHGDGELAAALWIGQLRMFRAGLEAMPQGRALDAERFFADPAGILRAAAELLGMAVSGQRIEDVVRSSLFATYAKRPGVAFDNASRIARREDLRAVIAPELATATDWVVRHAPECSEVLQVMASRRLAYSPGRSSGGGPPCAGPCG